MKRVQAQGASEAAESRWRTPQRRLAKWWSSGWVRVGLYGTLLSIACGAWTLRSVSAEVSERALGVGRGLLAMRDVIGDSTRLVINGQELEVTNLRTEQPLVTAFTRFAKSCELDHQDPLELLGAAHDGAPAPPSKLGVFQFQARPEEGVMFCFGGAAAEDYAALAARVKRFAASSDLSEMGQVRYLFGHEGGGRTTLLLVTSRGKLDLTAMFPERGDAPGSDLAPGVRPRAAGRALSVSAPGSGYSLAVYRGAEPPDAALRDYEAALRQGGFAVEPLAPQPGADEGLAMRLVRGEGGLAIVSAGVVDGETVVTAMRLGRDGAGVQR